MKTENNRSRKTAELAMREIYERKSTTGRKFALSFSSKKFDLEKKIMKNSSAITVEYYVWSIRIGVNFIKVQSNKSFLEAKKLKEACKKNGHFVDTPACIIVTEVGFLEEKRGIFENTTIYFMSEKQRKYIVDTLFG